VWYQARALLSGLPKHKRINRWLLMLQAYVDDSGSDLGGPVFVLAGYVSSASEWDQFSDKWYECLEKPNPRTGKKLEYFKTREAAGLEGQFMRWTAGERDTKIQELSRIISRYAWFGIESSINISAYNEAIRGQVSPEFDHPYMFCFMDIIFSIVYGQKQRSDHEKVDYIFDQQGALGNLAAGWYESFMELIDADTRSFVGDPVQFRGSKEFRPLQAADLIAWTTRRYFTDQFKNSPIPQRAIEPLLGIPHIPSTESRPQLLEAFHTIGARVDLLERLTSVSAALKFDKWKEKHRKS
jgi:hypothetical protein